MVFVNRFPAFLSQAYYTSLGCVWLGWEILETCPTDPGIWGLPHPGNLGRRGEGVSLGNSFCSGQQSFISRPPPQPGVGPAFQEQEACLAPSWNRLGADGTLLSVHCVEMGLPGPQADCGTLGVCPTLPQKKRLWQFASEMGKVRGSLDENVAEGTEVEDQGLVE